MRVVCGWITPRIVTNSIGAEVDIDEECDFEGDVSDPDLEPDGTFWWSCPTCGHEHHVDPAPDPEPEPAMEDGWLEAAYEDRNGGEVDVE